MKSRDYLFEVAPKIIPYELARRGFISPPPPLVLTFSVTASCRSLCKTCLIGRTFLDNPDLAKQDLTLEEVRKVFKSLGHVYFFNVSGGEPFMRMDLAEIMRLAAIHLTPRLMHIPTNALAPRAIEKTTHKILTYMDKYLPSSVPITIKPSIDGVGAMHDYIRGIKGNWEKLNETIDRLLAISAKHPRLHVDLGTVISNLNIHHLDEIENWVHARGVESYRHEIAEQRVEFHNIGDPITPPPDVYEKLTQRFAEKILQNVKKKAFLTRTTEAVRLAYYHVAVQNLRQRRQVTPCYGGISNIHLNYNGDIWPCCILGSEQLLGNVRDWDYAIQQLLSSEQARKARTYIAGKKCACPLANQWLSNVLLTPRHMLKALYNLLVRFPLTKLQSAQPIPVVHPEEIEVHISGTASRQALVLHHAGTIPTPEEAEIPLLTSNAGQGSPEGVNDESKQLLHRVHHIQRIQRTSQHLQQPEKAPPVHHVHHIRQVSASSYVLRMDRHGLEFTPGQYFTIGKKGGLDAREYTTYSSIQDDFLDFLITEVDGGKVSPALRQCTPGEPLEVEGPDGYFRLHEKTLSTTTYYFIATGSGIAPFHSFVQSYPGLDYTLLHGVRVAADCYDSDAYDAERYISCVSREAAGKFHGRVTDYLREHPVDPGALYYLCGNCDMLFEVYDILTQKNVPPEHIVTEVFY